MPDFNYESFIPWIRHTRTLLGAKKRNNDMKLATISFYYDFTRFFAALHGQTTPSGKAIKVCNYATHPSGYLFENASDMRRVFLPFAVRVRKTGISIPEQSLDFIGQYLEISGASTKRAREISRRYVAFFIKEFQKNRPDVVIISGDTRMQARSAVYACRKLGVRHLFFEQGPFGTTILDPTGVNCTASFAKNFPTARPSRQGGYKLDTFHEPLSVKAAQRKTVRALDYLLQLLFLPLGFQEVREEKNFLRQLHIQILNRKRRSVVTTARKSAPNPFVLVIGQVPTDSNFSINSPYKTFLQLICEIEEIFPTMEIIFREHPLFIGSYGREFYTHFAASSRLELSRGQSLDTEIETADHIVVVNSTAGMEVVLKHRKPLLCLGDASYAHLNGVFIREQLEDFHAADAHIDDADHMANCLWFQRSFLPGHFRDQNLQPLVSEVLKSIDQD